MRTAGRMAFKPKRWSIQLLSLAALHSGTMGEIKWLCMPVLSCHSCYLSWFACPIGIFVHYSGWRVFPFLAVGTVLVLGVLFGRLLCGWICPFGFLQDLLFRLRTPKFALPRVMNWGKYVSLAAGAILIPFFLGESTQWSFCRMCPASALQVTIPGLIGGLTLTLAKTVKLAILAAILVLAVFSSRSFCRMLCPIGAMLALFNRVSVGRTRTPTSACISCGRCDDSCPTAALPAGRVLRGTDPSRCEECVLCGRCREVCPVKDKPAPAGGAA